MKLLFVIVFLTLLLVLVAVFSQSSNKETFVDQDASPVLALQPLGRNIYFPYFAQSSLLLSQRAAVDNSISTTPTGKCLVLSSPPIDQNNQGYSIVRENSIYYILKKTCMALTFVSYEVKNDAVTITFDSSTQENLLNLTKFVLVNPILVEFGFDNPTSKLSSAYVPFVPITNDYSVVTKFSNDPQLASKTFIVKFKLPLSPEKGNCDKLLNYNAYSPNQKPATLAQFDSIRNSIINMWVYYLDDLDSGFQSVGKSFPMPLTHEIKGSSLTIYDKTFAKQGFPLQKAEFMNNLNIMYANYNIPILTFAFDLNISRNKSSTMPQGTVTSVFRCYSDNKYFGASKDVDSCANNNIVWAGVTSSPSGSSDKYELLVATSDTTSCGKENKFSPAATLTLPYLSENTPISIVITVTPNQRQVYAQWIDVNSGDIGRKFAYTKSQYNHVALPFNDLCRKQWDNTDLIKANTMTNMFGNKGKMEGVDGRPALENVYVKWGSFISSINSIAHGYINLNNLFSG